MDLQQRRFALWWKQERTGFWSLFQGNRDTDSQNHIEGMIREAFLAGWKANDEFRAAVARNDGSALLL